MRRTAATLLFILLLTSRLFAQSGNANLTGFIQDSSKAFVSGVRVLAVNTDTNQQFETKTNNDGSYNISSLPVGPYRLQIEKVGFRTLLKEGLFLHTQDVLQINFQMAVGSTSETVTVSTDSNNINTTDAAVGTVIDRQFVENIPMNGRSFQTLVLLSPGTITGTPQVSAGTPPSNDRANTA
jgi:Carboxypeptidase regulatory-like domain